MTTTEEKVNEDGSVSRITTTTFDNGDTEVVTHIITADEYQAEQDTIKAQIDALQAQLDIHQENTVAIQNKLKNISPADIIK